MGRNAKQAKNWIIDAVLFAGFIVSMVLDVTGVAAHEFLGAAVVALAGYHLVAHGQWVACTTQRFLGNLGAQCRRVYLVDAALFVGFAAIGVTGLAISTWLSLPLGSYLVWRDAHVYASVASLALIVVKVGLHWRWIANVANRDVFRGLPAAQPSLAPVAVPVRVGGRVGRRDFVRVMGIVGAASLAVGARVIAQTTAGEVEANDGALALAAAAPTASPMPQALGSTASAVAATAAATTTPTAAAPMATVARPAQQSTIVAKATSTPVTLAAASTAKTAATTSSACVVQCARRCSYPGQCRRYVDFNKNGKCDLGECTA